MEWFEPRSFKEWLTRAFGLRPVLLVLLIIGAFISELRFDWIERALGAYLVTTNSKRPESGAIWEIGHRKMTAQKTLDQIITDRMAIQREVRDATNLVELAENISSGKGGVMLSPEHFKTLYLGMPLSVAQEVLSPLELIRILNDDRWDRTYFEKDDENLTIYLLDRQNKVLRQLEISSDLLYQIKKQEFARTGELENLTKFDNRIYPAGRFFEALDTLPEDVRRSIITHPEVLLKMSGKIIRIGISDETIAGFIELGFEIDTGERKRIIFIQGREWAVWLLRSALEGKQPARNPVTGIQTNKIP